LCRPFLSLALAFGLWPAVLSAGEGGELEVTGEVMATTPRLEVRVAVRNTGDLPVVSLDVTGELLGQRRTARLPGVLGPHLVSAVALDFDSSQAVPGAYALALLLEHPLGGAPDAAGNPPMASQRAWLPVALGANPPPAVRVRAPEAALDVRGALDVSLESVDGARHRVRLRALTPRGVRADVGEIVLDVPAAGALRTRLPLVRAGAPRGTRHGVLLVAETVAGSPVRTSAAMVTVLVLPDRSLLPRLHAPLLALAMLMLAASVGYEAWRGWRRAGRAPDEGSRTAPEA
jgi:hypothetical protein